MKKYIAEVIGTFALALVVGLSIKVGFPVITPVLAALTLGLFVYSIGNISGSHINPAVTLGLLSIKKISLNDALFYIVAQFIGAGLAMYVMSTTVGTNSLTISNSMLVFCAEALGTFFFTFGIASVVYGKAASVASGLVVGGSLLLGICFAVLLGSNGVLNPAAAFGIGSFSLVYALAPILGSVVGMNVYKYISE